MVLGRIVEVIVDAHDQREIRAFGGRADQHRLRAGGEVRGGLVALGEEAGALEHDVDPEGLPRQLGRVLQREDLDALAADRDRFLVVGDRAAGLEFAVNRVVLEQVRERLRVGQVVDGDDLDVGDPALDERADDAASDPSETIDSDFRRHRQNSRQFVRLRALS